MKRPGQADHPFAEWKRFFTTYSADTLAGLFLIAFIVIKWPYLSLPYFWDAVWVYAPAIQEMAKTIPSIVPDVISTNLSRAHPLLFHFLGGLWIKLWGNTVFNLNVLALIISTLTLASIYVTGKYFHRSETGLWAMAFCAIQEIFLAQSVQILPEMLLTLNVILVIYFFGRGHFWGTVVMATLLLYTKESGAVLILAMGLWTILDLAVRRPQGWGHIFSRRLAMLGLPVALASLHFLYLKWKFGWFLYPEHLDYLERDIGTIWHKAKYIFDFIFRRQGRDWFTLGGAAVMVWFWYGHRWAFKFLLIAALWLLYWLFYQGGGWSYLWRFVIIVPLAVALWWWIVSKIHESQPRLAYVLGLTSIYVLLFIWWSAYNVFTVRYVLNLIPIYALYLGVVVGRMQIPLRWIPVGVLALSLVALVNIRQPDGISDIDLNYADGVRVHQSMVNYFHDSLPPAFALGTLLEKAALEDPRAGYLEGREKQITVDLAPARHLKYGIRTNIDLSVPINSFDTLGFKPLHKISRGEAWIEIFTNDSILLQTKINH